MVTLSVKVLLFPCRMKVEEIQNYKTSIIKQDIINTTYRTPDKYLQYDIDVHIKYVSYNQIYFIIQVLECVFCILQTPHPTKQLLHKPIYCSTPGLNPRYTPYHVPSFHMTPNVSRHVTLNSSGSENNSTGSSTSSSDSFHPQVPYNTPDGSAPIPGIPILQIVDVRNIDQKLCQPHGLTYEDKREIHVEKERERRQE